MATYRVAQIIDLEPLDERFTRPEGFDLAAHWRAYLAAFDERRHTGEATVRLSPEVLRTLPDTMPAAVVRAVRRTGTPDDPPGWVRATIPIESIDHATGELLRLGTGVEVLAPPDLRERIATTAAVLAGRHRLPALGPAGGAADRAGGVTHPA